MGVFARWVAGVWCLRFLVVFVWGVCVFVCVFALLVWAPLACAAPRLCVGVVTVMGRGMVVPPHTVWRWAASVALWRGKRGGVWRVGACAWCANTCAHAQRGEGRGGSGRAWWRGRDQFSLGWWKSRLVVGVFARWVFAFSGCVRFALAALPCRLLGAHAPRVGGFGVGGLGRVGAGWGGT